MAKRPKPIVGLEIEPSAVRAASVAGGSSLAVRTQLERALEPGIVRDGEVADVAALATVLRDLFADGKLDKRVRIGIANQKILVRTIELPPITDAAELAAAVRFQAADELPMPLDGAVLDHQSLGIVDTPDGPRTRVMLVAARRDMVERVLSAARAAGLRPEGIDLAAFGMVRALSQGAPTDESVLYLGVGGLTNLAVAQGTSCHFTRVVGGGLEAFATELAERLAIPRDEAHELVLTVGLDGARLGEDDLHDDVRRLLREGVRRLAGEVRTTTDFHQMQDRSVAPVGRCVLTGPAAAVPGFVDALANELGLPVSVGVVAGEGEEGAGRIATAAGLALAEAFG